MPDSIFSWARLRPAQGISWSRSDFFFDNFIWWLWQLRIKATPPPPLQGSMHSHTSTRVVFNMHIHGECFIYKDTEFSNRLWEWYVTTRDGHRNKIRVTWFILDLVPVAMDLVLSSFICNLLSLIHSTISSIQSFKLWTRAGKSEAILELCKWESSAKKWYEWPDWQMTLQRGCVYKVNKRSQNLTLWHTTFQSGWSWFMTNKKQTECNNLNREWTFTWPFQNSPKLYVTF